MKSIATLRHEKEKTYFSIMLVVSVVIWLLLAIGLLVSLIALAPFILIGVFIAWLASQYFKAVLYGNSVKVTERQYPEIDRIAKAYSAELGMSKSPEIFIENGNGTVNAFAVRQLSKKYVILKSDLVDLMLKRGRMVELSTIIGHELAHHAAGHTAFLRNVLIWPGRIIPFLGGAYGRACELTADRIGLALTGDLQAAQNALIAITSGSQSLADQTDIEAFIRQENDIPSVMGFVHKVFSSHPRMTRRVIELQNYRANI